MQKGIEVRLGPDDRERLEAVIGSGNSQQKHVWRARIVLLSADGIGTWHPAPDRQGKADDLAMAGAVYGRPSRWAAARRDAARPPGEATHWTGRAMAKAAGISLRSVQRIWGAHGFNCCQMIEDHSPYDVRLVPCVDGSALARVFFDGDARLVGAAMCPAC